MRNDINCKWCGKGYSTFSSFGFNHNRRFCSRKCQHEYELAEGQHIISDNETPANSKPKKKGCLIVIIAIVIIYALSQ